MAWETPKSDYAVNYILTPTDFNRIEGNINYLREENKTINGTTTFAEEVQVNSSLNATGNVRSGRFFSGENILESTLYTALSSWLPSILDRLSCTGYADATGVAYSLGGEIGSIQYIVRTGSTQFRIYYLDLVGSGLTADGGYVNVSSTGTKTIPALSIETIHDIINV